MVLPAVVDVKPSEGADRDQEHMEGKTMYLQSLNTVLLQTNHAPHSMHLRCGRWQMSGTSGPAGNS